MIDYLLQAVPAGPVTLEIRSAAGDLVRRFSSEDRATPPAPPAEPPQIADEWLPRLNVPTRNAGHNRFVWDLRYPPPPAERYGYSIAAIAGQGTVAEPQGPLVLPGVYEVRLGVEGRTYSARLRIELDPRVHVADSALAAQLRLALDIGDAMGGARALEGPARSLGSQLGAVDQRSLDRTARQATAALAAATDSVVRAAGGVGGDLAGLETTVQSADREPAQQMRDAFAAATQRLAAAAARWQQVLARELPALNARLRRKGGKLLEAR